MFRKKVTHRVRAAKRKLGVLTGILMAFIVLFIFDKYANEKTVRVISSKAYFGTVTL